MGINTIDHDRTLLARVVDGDERALDLLYRSHGRVAFNVALRVLRDSSLAEDAVQEGFLDLWRTADRFDPRRSSVRSWLCVLVHRRAVDLVRREASRRALDDRQPPPDPQSSTAEEVLFLHYDRRRIQKVLRELPAPQRQLLEHAYWGGLTQSQLATRFELPLGTVKSRMFSALEDLRVALVSTA
jgi:RNA polymerase sigma factor (sigma-70 family)